MGSNMKYYQPQHHHKIQISQTLGVSKKSPTLAKSQFLLQRKTNQSNFMAQTSLTPRTGVHVTMFNRQPNIEIFISIEDHWVSIQTRYSPLRLPQISVQIFPSRLRWRPREHLRRRVQLDRVGPKSLADLRLNATQRWWWWCFTLGFQDNKNDAISWGY